ncbi:hypothetical protein VTK73DRAFT_7717 [Phialemonium thermophilum]|uniref:Uncharacterized protein n=1 Tax=Phialemonium thermophilum TaxID=223376 RepID=A0ABR3WD99_9PEZI
MSATTKTRHALHFINLSHPTDAKSTDRRQQARSFAARSAHARRRALRMLEHQAQMERDPCPVLYEEDEAQRDGRFLEAQSSNIDSGIFPPIAIRSAVKVPQEDALYVPSPLGPLSADRRDPFASLACPLRPLEQFLLDHYVTSVIPYLNAHCKTSAVFIHDGRRVLLSWTRIAIENPDLIRGLLLQACRHMCAVEHQQEKYSQLAIRYKLACIRALSAAIASEPVRPDGSALSLALALAFDEGWVGNNTTFRYHVNGAMKIAELHRSRQIMNLVLEELLERFIEDITPGSPFLESHASRG